MSDGPEIKAGEGDTPEDAAAEWDALLRSPECTDADREAFRVWREADPAHERAFERFQSILSALRDERDRPEFQAMREAALQAAPEVRKPGWRRVVTIGLPLAAAAAFGIILVQQIGIAPEHTAPTVTANIEDLGADRAPIQTVDMHVPPFYATAVGERSTVTLDDGSHATLNTDTLIRTRYTEAERLIVLEKGQASFDVETDPSRPFVVAAGDRRIRALGTVFDVRLDAGEVRVTLIEGVVEVEPNQIDDDGLLQASPARLSEAPTRMEAGQKLVALRGEPAKLLQESEVDLELETIWQEGRVFFKDASLREAVAEMNRYYDVKIIASDPLLDQFRVNGMFRTARQESFVSSIEAYFPVEAEAEAEGEIVLKLSQ